MGFGDWVTWAPGWAIRNILADASRATFEGPYGDYVRLDTLPRQVQEAYRRDYPDERRAIHEPATADVQRGGMGDRVMPESANYVRVLTPHGYETIAADVPVDDDVLFPLPIWQKKLAGGERLKLNMGAGDQRYKGYVGIDIQPTPACDLVHDLEEVLPLPDGCASHIFCSHTLEHLHMWKVPLVLKDWHRVLADGGILWGYVPDCEAAAQLFLDTNLRIGTAEDDGTAQWAHQKATEIMLGSSSYDFRRGDEQTHHCAFTHKSLRGVLNAGGFQGVQINRERPGPWDMRLAFFACKGVYPEHELPEPALTGQVP